MTILRLSRWGLLASVMLWAASLVLIITAIGPTDLLTLLSVVASLLIVISACACVIAQLLIAVRVTKTPRNGQGVDGLGDG